MKPITIAKNVWNHANELQNKIDTGIIKRESVMYHYFGILTMYASVQAAHYSDDKEWLAEVNDMLDKYPYEFESDKFYFKYNFCRIFCQLFYLFHTFISHGLSYKNLL